MVTLNISVLGHLQISAGQTILDKFESNKVRALFVYLVVEKERPHSREALAELVWPEATAQSSLANLRYALADLRKVIGDEKANPPHLIISRENLQFNAASDCELDAATFSELLNSGNIEKLKQGIALYQGDFLASFPSIESDPFEEWILLKRSNTSGKPSSPWASSLTITNNEANINRLCLSRTDKWNSNPGSKKPTSN